MPNPPENTLNGEFILPTSDNSTPVESAKSPQKTPSAIPIRSHSKPKFYSSLCYYPDGVTFQNQEADEEVVLLIRRDFITNVPWIISILLLSLVPIVLFFTVPIFFPNISVSQLLITLSFSFYYVVLFAFAVLYFTIWYFNVGLVTNKRIIDLDVANILVKETSEARLSSIADISYTQVGGIRGIFDYGDVRVLTETYEQNIEFDRAPNPNMIRRVIGELLIDKGTT